MYNEVLNVVNAEAVGQTTNGTATFQVTSTDFNLLPDFSNMVNVTYFIDATSQVPLHAPALFHGVPNKTCDTNVHLLWRILDNEVLKDFSSVPNATSCRVNSMHGLKGQILALSMPAPQQLKNQQCIGNPVLLSNETYLHLLHKKE